MLIKLILFILNINLILGFIYNIKIRKKIDCKLININKIVISTGGGIILKNKNILEKSFNIYLQCDENILIERASRNKDRPLLLKDIKKI